MNGEILLGIGKTLFNWTVAYSQWLFISLLVIVVITAICSGGFGNLDWKQKEK